MGRPKLRENETATRERLLGAAALEFAERGYEGARLQDIAERAGITRPSLLYHYPSKQDLYAEVITSIFAELGAALGEGTKEKGSFLERFDAVARKLVAFFDEMPEVATLILREVMDAKGPGHAILLEAGVPILQRLERFMREEGRPHVRAELPIRAALLEIFSTVMVRAAAGPLREPFWGKTDKTRALARALFLENAPATGPSEGD